MSPYSICRCPNPTASPWPPSWWASACTASSSPATAGPDTSSGRSASGVRGFLPKTTEAARLAEVIRTVAGGGRYVDPELAAEAIGAGDSPLTPREADCLELAADGATIDDIAAKAHLSPGTVRNYLSSAITKLGAANRHDACAIAARMGWI